MLATTARMMRPSCARLAATTLVLVGVLAVPGIAHGQSPGRAYELVSPAEKEKGSVLYVSGGTPPRSMSGASDDGERAIFISYQAFAGSEHGLNSSYAAHRTSDGWKTEPFSPRLATENPTLQDISLIQDVSRDFKTGIFDTRDHFTPFDDDPFFLNFQSDDVYTRALGEVPKWISGNDGVLSSAPVQAAYAGSSDDASSVVFMTTEVLTPDAGSQVAGRYVYMKSDGALRLVNGLSGGGTVNACGAAVGGQLDFSVQTSQNAVSGDASQVYFQVPDPEGQFSSADPACTEPSRLYMRRGDQDPIEVSASQSSTPPPPTPAPASYQGAARDGSSVYFTSTDQLTDDATPGGGLYRFETLTRRLSFASPGSTDPAGAQLQGVVKVSEDGSSASFIATDRLVAGRGVQGEPNLYLAEPDGVEFIGTLSWNDVGYLTQTPDRARAASVTPDGSRTVFISSADLTPYAAGGRAMAYLFDSSDGTVTCLSCRPDGSAPEGDSLLSSAIQYRAAPTKIARNITDDGRRAFFETRDPLVAEDVNRASDVYEYVDGKLYMVSSGTARYGSYFFDASRDGEDLFLATSDSLVAQDTDGGDNDIYDARIGGGFAPPAPRPNCENDSCQNAPTVPPAVDAPRSPTATGPEDPAAVEPPISVARVRFMRVSAKATRKLARTGRLTLRVQADAAGRVHAIARAWMARRNVVVASAAKATSRPGSVALELVLSRAARRQLRNRGRLTVRVTPNLSDIVRGRTITLTLRVSRSDGSRR